MTESRARQDGFPRETFFTEYGAAIDNGTAAVFAGAALSRPAGFVDWKELLRDLAHELGLDVEIEQDLSLVAQYHINASNQSRDRLNQLLVNEFSQSARPTTAHEVLARLPIRIFWTTNYDPLIEDALDAQGKKVDVKTAGSRLTTTRPGWHAAVYKMHGDIADPERMVITRDDYERYARNHAPFLAALQADLVGKTFLFLGFSFTDPNLDFVLGQLRASLGDSPRTHYIIMRRVQRGDYRLKRQFEYAANRQRLRIQDLQRYGIKTILVDAYSEISEILTELERRYYRRQIVVSGAASSFEPLGQARLEDLCRRLGMRIIEDGYNLVTGFGLGVGNPIIMGALETLYRDPEPALERRLRLRPFPQVPPAKMAWPELHTRYREDLLRGAGFIVFVAGNRSASDGAVEVSPGVLEEFRMARDRNMYPIPIGATGWAAEKIWREVRNTFDQVYPGGTPRRPFEKLADSDASNEALIEAAFALIHHLTPRPTLTPRQRRRT